MLSHATSDAAVRRISASQATPSSPITPLRRTGLDRRAAGAYSEPDGHLVSPTAASLAVSLVPLIRASRLFSGVPEDLLGALAGAVSLGRYAGRAHLWREGDPADRVVSIVTGLVEITRQSAAGDPATWALFGPREAIGLTAALEGAAYPADAIALTDEVTALEVRAAALLDHMGAHPEVALAVNRALLDHTRALHQKIGVMTAGPVASRLATLLLELAARFGDEAADGTTRVPIALSRAQLAALVGARVETVIRTLSAWQREGWLRAERDALELARDHPLDHLAAGA